MHLDLEKSCLKVTLTEKMLIDFAQRITYEVTKIGEFMTLGLYEIHKNENADFPK
jgi:hypothetical protein